MTAAIPLEPYVVRVSFGNGETRDVDIEPLLTGEVFRALSDPELFSQVRVDDHGDTIVWPNGADIDPEVLYGAEKPSGEPRPRVSAPQQSSSP